MPVIDLQKIRDDQLRTEYLALWRSLGLTDPRLLAEMAQSLTPQVVAEHRKTLEAAVRGELHCPCPPGFI